MDLSVLNSLSNMELIPVYILDKDPCTSGNYLFARCIWIVTMALSHFSFFTVVPPIALGSFRVLQSLTRSLWQWPALCKHVLIQVHPDQICLWAHAPTAASQLGLLCCVPFMHLLAVCTCKLAFHGKELGPMDKCSLFLPATPWTVLRHISCFFSDNPTVWSDQWPIM